MSLNTKTGIVALILAISPLAAFAADQNGAMNSVKSASNEMATGTEDTAITTQVKALFALESDIRSFDLHVTTTNHVVYLSGKVDTQLQANKAVELATSVKGVNDVDSSKLSVTNSDSYLDDAFTTAKVKGKIAQLGRNNAISSNNDLHVETTNGVVHIFGKVGNRKDISTIEQAVAKLNGVKDVKADIDVTKK